MAKNKSRPRSRGVHETRPDAINCGDQMLVAARVQSPDTHLLDGNHWKREFAQKVDLADPAAANEVTTPEPKTPLRASIDAAFLYDASVRKALTENLKPLRAESDAIEHRVDKAFEDFSPRNLSLEDRARRRYLAPGADPYAMVESVIKDGVHALKVSANGRAITLRKNPDLDRLIKRSSKVKPARSGKGVVTLGALIDYINGKSQGTTVMARSMREIQKAENDADAILEIVENGSDKTVVRNVAAQQGSAAIREADAFVKDAVSVQMKTASAPESHVAFGRIPNGADSHEGQSQILEKIKLGPADVTSYHDFHTLQIAFEHVWTEIFDGQLASLGRDLYREYVRLKEFSGSGQPDLRVGTLADLKRLIEEVQKLSQVVEQDIPSGLRGQENKPEDTGTGSFEKGLLQPGVKPTLTWEQLDGRELPGNAGTIEAKTFDDAPDGLVTIALRTDPGSPRKIIDFELFDPRSGTFVHGPSAWRASSAGQLTYSEFHIPSPLVEMGALEFSSQHTEVSDLGRYFLKDLNKRLGNRKRVVFHWKDT
ncbi:MAG TPA: hypothetical protein VFU13_09050 [Steroidobacteraceae bacterium]|nr:hypothetical protein [Steroidobacteraceae bacterium]